MHPTIETIDNVEDSTQNGLPSTEPMISSSMEDRRDEQEDSDRSMEIGCPSADSLSLFRSFSMPIHISSTNGSDHEEPLDRTQEDVNQDEEDEDLDELLTTPTSQLQLHDPSSYSSYQVGHPIRLSFCFLDHSLRDLGLTILLPFNLAFIAIAVEWPKVIVMFTSAIAQ
jgi:hypothetical protein